MQLVPLGLIQEVLYDARLVEIAPHDVLGDSQCALFLQAADLFEENA